MINPLKYLSQLNNFSYALLKFNPELYNRENFEHLKGSDLDILVADSEVLEFSKKLIEMLVAEEYELKLTLTKPGFHIDIVSAGKIEFRFDILVAPQIDYQKLDIDNMLFKTMLLDVVTTEVANYIVKIPNELDTNLVRYFEYIEYYSQRKDKIKHLDWILTKFEDQPELKNKFFKKLHLFTKVKLQNPPSGSHFSDIVITESKKQTTDIFSKLKSVLIGK